MKREKSYTIQQLGEVELTPKVIDALEELDQLAITLSLDKKKVIIKLTVEMSTIMFMVLVGALLGGSSGIGFAIAILKRVLGQ